MQPNSCKCVELTGNVGFGDAVVVGWKEVAGEAEGAGPDPIDEVDAAEGVEDGEAGGLAAERRVRKDEVVGDWVYRGDRGGEGDDALGGLDFGARPCVPGHADAAGISGRWRSGAGHVRGHLWAWISCGFEKGIEIRGFGAFPSNSLGFFSSFSHLITIFF